MQLAVHLRHSPLRSRHLMRCRLARDPGHDGRGRSAHNWTEVRRKWHQGVDPTMNALDTPLEGLSTSPPMRAPLLVIVILALTGAILTSLDSRTGLTFALACLYFNFLTIHLESGIYIILAAAVIFVDGWA